MEINTHPAPTRARRRPRISQRGWSSAQRLLRDYGITQSCIAEHADVSHSSVNRALDLKSCARTQHGIVAAVRRASEALLIVVGAEFDAETLWLEYDDAQG